MSASRCSPKVPRCICNAQTTGARCPTTQSPRSNAQARDLPAERLAAGLPAAQMQSVAGVQALARRLRAPRLFACTWAEILPQLPWTLRTLTGRPSEAALRHLQETGAAPSFSDAISGRRAGCAPPLARSDSVCAHMGGDSAPTAVDTEAALRRRFKEASRREALVCLML